MPADPAFEEFVDKNGIQMLDDPFRYNEAEDNQIRLNKPWQQDPNYFSKVKISAPAMVKMVTHARSGGDLEIMGMLLGRVEKNSFIVVDCFALPVEGTETRVNAQTEAYEYMSRYVDLYQKAGYKEKVLGWYHSHPGYGCWLSGIDVDTQKLNQQFTEPFLAIVVDPVRTLSSGKVDLGAFRTYPDDYVAERTALTDKYIPMHKAEDFGHHRNKYYSLEVSYFMSSIDTRLLNHFWNSYWVETIASNKLNNISGYLNSQLSNLGSILKTVNHDRLKGDKAAVLIEKAGEESHKLMIEATNGLLQEYFKSTFCSGPSENKEPAKTTQAASGSATT